MAQQRLGIIMNGVTGRMGMNQHLVRSILAIRAQAGVKLKNGDTVMPDPILVGRNEAKLAQLAKAHAIARWTTDLSAAFKSREDTLFFDAATTKLRAKLLRRAIAAGKDIYCEKPIAETLEDALEVARAAKAAGIRHGVVQDKLFLPGLLKLKMLIDSGFFGSILAMRGHWRYVLDNLFGEVKSVSCLGATHIPKRWDENDKPYNADVDDAAYATFQLANGVVAHINSSWCTRVRRDDLVTFHVDGTLGSAVAGLQKCWSQARVNTPRPVWNPDVPQPIKFFETWSEVPGDNYDNGFKAEWEIFIRHLYEGAPFKWTLLEGAKGVQLAEAGLRSWKERRWIDIPALEV